jgi:hypothetical protein
MMSETQFAKPLNLSVAHERRVAFLYFVPVGVSLSRVLAAKYWGGVVQLLGRTNWSTIEAISEDGSWEALLRVTSILPDGSGANVRLLWAWSHQAEALPALPDGFKVEFLPGQQGWRALSDKAEVPLGSKADVGGAQGDAQ